MSNVSLCASALTIAASSQFDFQSNPVRTIAENGEIWFVAKDVALALDYSQSSVNQIVNLFRNVPNEWKGIKPINTLGGEQKLLMISEQGLYFFLGRSDKPKALPFQKWLAGEVLPVIRKTGAYIHAQAMRPTLTLEQQRELKADIRRLFANWLNLKDQWVYNHMRVAFHVAKFEHIPQDLFPVAKQLIASKRESTLQFLCFLRELRDWFERECLGAGTPWTPAIRNKLIRQLKCQVILPPKVDWLALVQENNIHCEGAEK